MDDVTRAARPTVRALLLRALGRASLHAATAHTTTPLPLFGSPPPYAALAAVRWGDAVVAGSSARRALDAALLDELPPADGSLGACATAALRVALACRDEAAEACRVGYDAIHAGEWRAVPDEWCVGVWGCVGVGRGVAETWGLQAVCRARCRRRGGTKTSRRRARLMITPPHRCLSSPTTTHLCTHPCTHTLLCSRWAYATACEAHTAAEVACGWLGDVLAANPSHANAAAAHPLPRLRPACVAALRVLDVALMLCPPRRPLPSSPPSLQRADGENGDSDAHFRLLAAVADIQRVVTPDAAADTLRNAAPWVTRPRPAEAANEPNARPPPPVSTRFSVPSCPACGGASCVTAPAVPTATPVPREAAPPSLTGFLQRYVSWEGLVGGGASVVSSPGRGNCSDGGAAVASTASGEAGLVRAPAALTVVRGLPVVLSGAMSHWPAMTRWPTPGYLASVAGLRTVPVEIGAHYMAPGWAAGRLTPLSAFLSEHMPSLMPPDEGARRAPPADAVSSAPQPLARDAAVAYLAQHRLFEQVPDLARDVCVPDYCGLLPPRAQTRPPPPRGTGGPLPGVGSGSGGSSGDGCAALGGSGSCGGAGCGTGVQADRRDAADAAADDDDRGDGDASGGGDVNGDVAMHAWLGPAGTVSCLHTDAPHNLLAQVLGCKRVLLAPPSHSAAVYPHPGIMRNTAQVDPEVHWRAEAGCGAAGEGGGGGGGVAGDPQATGQRLAGSKRGRGGDGSYATDDEAIASTTHGHHPFPAFPRVPLLEAFLGPGDMLYIPPGWWHHVRSLAPSFSVSFWWG